MQFCVRGFLQFDYVSEFSDRVTPSLPGTNSNSRSTKLGRILAPIVIAINEIPKLCKESSQLSKWITVTFGGPQKLKKDILYDFFKNAFDRSEEAYNSAALHKELRLFSSN